MASGLRDVAGSFPGLNDDGGEGEGDGEGGAGRPTLPGRPITDAVHFAATHS